MGRGGGRALERGGGSHPTRCRALTEGANQRHSTVITDRISGALELTPKRAGRRGRGEGGKGGGERERETREEPLANCVFVLLRGWVGVVVELVSWDVVRVVWYDVVLRVVLGAIPCVVSNNRVLWCFVLCRLYNLICGEVEL